MKQFASDLLAMVDGSTISNEILSATKTGENYSVAFLAAPDRKTAFSLSELKEEAQYDFERKLKKTVLVKSEGEYRTDFYAKNSLTLPTDNALVLVELSNFITFAKDPSKLASDKITRDRLAAEDRSKELFGCLNEKGKWEQGSVQKDLTSQVKQYNWEKAKQQAAKLCGGVNVASRGNHIDFQASCINQKTGKVRSFKQSNKQFEKQSANPRVNFKAKENYNSSGAVRGGAGKLEYISTPSDWPDSPEEIAAKEAKEAKRAKNAKAKAKRKANKAKGK